MAQQHINYGASPNDGTGDTLRVSQIKAESNFNELYANKVDKVVGKVLSDTNYTQAEKDQLAALVAAGGNVQSDWNEGDSGNPAYIQNKPENTSDFTNDGDGTAPYVPDTTSTGRKVRVIGGWELLANASTPVIMDGIIGVTVGFVVAQTIFTLPAGAKCIDVYLAHTKQYKITPNNGTLVNRWSQTGNDVTITKSPVLNNYLYIEYIL